MSDDKSVGCSKIYLGLVLVVLSCIVLAKMGGITWEGFSYLIGFVLITAGALIGIACCHQCHSSSTVWMTLTSLTYLVVGLLSLFLTLGPVGWSILFVIFFLLRGLWLLFASGCCREHGRWCWPFAVAIFSFFMALLMWLNWTVGPEMLAFFVGFSLLFGGFSAIGWGCHDCSYKCPAKEEEK